MEARIDIGGDDLAGYGQEWLVDRIKEEAKVRDVETGYVFWSELNHLVDPRLLEVLGQVIEEQFVSRIPDGRKPEKVLGISNRGRGLAGVLGRRLELKVAETDRDVEGGIDDEPVGGFYDNEEDWVVIEHVRSFTKRVNYRHTIRGVRPGDRVLVSDDFSARGHAVRSFDGVLRRLDITPYFGIAVAKDFDFLDPPQVGYRRLKEEGVPVFAAVRLVGMEDGRVIATAEDI
jgi:adenine/guanine phosphoribosyltransferase-like PRPP-binding protein